MSNHTPGPWGYDEIDRVVVKESVADIPYMDRTASNPDARLITAAPEILEALRWYAELAEDLNRYPWTVESTLAELRNDGGKRAKEAIAKAKGESGE